MGGFSDSHHFRKTVAGAAMIGAPLFALIAYVVIPKLHTDEGAQLGSIAAHADRWMASVMFSALAIVCAMLATLGLMHMLRERQVTLGHVGGGLAMVGLLAFVGIVAMELVLWQLLREGDTATAVTLLQGLNESAGILIPFALMSFGFAIGMALLAVGLYRARAVQSWMAVCVGVGAILVGFAFGTALNWLAIVAAAFLVVGLGTIGRMVLRETDEAWEHTPEYEGFRPVPGMR